MRSWTGAKRRLKIGPRMPSHLSIVYTSAHFWRNRQQRNEIGLKRAKHITAFCARKRCVSTKLSWANLDVEIASRLALVLGLHRVGIEPTTQ